MPLTLTTAPAKEPVTWDEAKAWLRLPNDDDKTDVEKIIVAAREHAEGRTGRALITQDWTLRLDSFPGEFLLYKPPCQEVVHLKYTDGFGVAQTLVEGTDYQVDLYSQPARVGPYRGTSWPTPLDDTYNAVELQFKAGYGDDETYVPQGIRAAMKKIITQTYENRDNWITGTIIVSVPREADVDLGGYKVNWV